MSELLVFPAIVIMGCLAGAALSIFGALFER